MWMVLSDYVGNDQFFDRMLITILFENLCWDKAMKHVLRFANSPYLGFFKHIDDEAYVHTMVSPLISIAFFTIISCASTVLALRPMK